MACSTRPGTATYLKFIEDTMGVKISQAEWHELRDMAREDAIREEYWRLRDDMPSEDAQGRPITDSDLMSLARLSKQDIMNRSRVERDDAVMAADRLAERVFAELPPTEAGDPREEDQVEAKEDMQARLYDVPVTQATVTTIDGMADRGVRLSIATARGRIKQKRQALMEKRAVAKAAAAETDPVMSAGLYKAASLMDQNGDWQVTQWRLSGNAEFEYPGISERYAEITRGPKEAREFSMFSREGNIAALEASKELEDRIRAGKVAEEDAVREIHKALDRVEKEYPEVWDTEPRGEFFHRVNAVGREMGWREVE